MKSITRRLVLLSAIALSGSLALAQNSGVALDSVAIDHAIYLAHLPTIADLTNGAEAKGTPIVRMEPTDNQITVTYQYTGGRVVTFAYILLSSISHAQPDAFQQSAPQVIQSISIQQNQQGVGNAVSSVQYLEPQGVFNQPATVYEQPSVVYVQPAPSYYYTSDPSYYNGWASLAFGVGLGWIWGSNYYYHGGGHSYYHGGGYGHSNYHGGENGHGDSHGGGTGHGGGGHDHH